jgi:hypothetical protein
LIAKREYFSLLPLLPVLKYLGSVLIKFAEVLQVRQELCLLNPRLTRFKLYAREQKLKLIIFACLFKGIRTATQGTITNLFMNLEHVVSVFFMVAVVL